MMFLGGLTLHLVCVPIKVVVKILYSLHSIGSLDGDLIG
jgi:hypothetical protein